jgi:hypothetical protein
LWLRCPTDSNTINASNKLLFTLLSVGFINNKRKCRKWFQWWCWIDKWHVSNNSWETMCRHRSKGKCWQWRKIDYYRCVDVDKIKRRVDNEQQKNNGDVIFFEKGDDVCWTIKISIKVSSFFVQRNRLISWQ